MLGRLFAPPCGGFGAFRPIGLIPGGGAIPGGGVAVAPPRIPGGGAIPGVDADPPRDAPRPQPAFGRCIPTPIPGGGGGAAAPVLFAPGRRGGDREFRRCLPPDITMGVCARRRLATLGGSQNISFWVNV